MGLWRSTDEYISGVNNFFDTNFQRTSKEDEILCPCKKCANCKCYQRNVVEDHLVVYGFLQGYTKWIFQGERVSSRKNLDNYKVPTCVTILMAYFMILLEMLHLI